MRKGSETKSKYWRITVRIPLDVADKIMAMGKFGTSANGLINQLLLDAIAGKNSKK